MKKIALLFAFCLIALSSITRADTIGISDLDPKKVPLIEVRGIKYPNTADEGSKPVEDIAKLWDESLGGFSELIPFVLKSPNQEEAGSCLYMANTGMAEWWLASLDPEVSREPEGPIDLSERHLMNLASSGEMSIENWKLDTILLFNNNNNTGVRNTAFRFTKGWYKRDGSNNIYPSQPETPGASYGTSYNWINELSKINGGSVSLPTFERNILFADPQSNQWNVGVAPETIIIQVKEALIETKAPVQVIYNHFGYWHAVFIIGFNDELESDQCSFVERSRSYLVQKVEGYRRQLEGTTDPSERERLLSRIAKSTKTSQDLETSYATNGGCKNKGVFYVRDSIYSETTGPLYDYDKSREGEEAQYSKAIILHEYEWLLYLSNHVTQIIAE